MGDKGFYNGVQKWGETLLKRYGKTKERKNQVLLLGARSNKSPGARFAHAVNPQAPVAQKIADEVVYRRFQGEGVEFF